MTNDMTFTHTSLIRSSGELSWGTWLSLADEYDQALAWHFNPGRHRWLADAGANAEALAEFVRSQTTTIVDKHGELTALFVRDTPEVWWIPFDEDPEPYHDLEHMSTCYSEALETPLRMLVSDCFHDHPVFSREDNLRFRVWHDTDHVQLGLSFSANDEVELFVRQARELPSQQLVDALFCEPIYQLAWAHVHGEFPDRQVVRTPGPVGRALLDAWGL